ncbi:MAG: nucleotidyltransferase, partial [Bacillota bacterium]
RIHLQKSIAHSNADATICIMSGSFLQRGTAAIVNHWARTKMALAAGVDLIIQLPISYSTRSAEYFAQGSVKLLTAANIVDCLCFGSELGTIEPLQYIGQLLAQEPEQLSQLIQKKLATGSSYPQARAQAVLDYFKNHSPQSDFSETELTTILQNSNNILGLEYIKALTNLNSSITPLTIKREGADYNSEELTTIASATAIRKAIKKNKRQNNSLINQQLESKMPKTTTTILQQEFSAGKGPIFDQDFELQILTLLRRMATADLKKYEGVTGGLENRIKSAAEQSTSWSELISNIKTKRFTQTRIQRILIHILLDLQIKDLQAFEQAGGPLYFRILGFNQQGKKLLHQIKTKGSLPLVSKVANHFKSNYQPQNLMQKMLHYDIKANNLYRLAANNPEHKKGNIDYQQQPIIDFK